MTTQNLAPNDDTPIIFDERAPGGSDPGRGATIKSVCYVTMAFPVPSEAFASVEINELQRRKIDVTVKTIRHRRSDFKTVATQQQVQSVVVQHADWYSPIRGFVLAVLQPRLSISLWWKLITTLVKRPLVMLACMFWSLRCFEILTAVRRENPDVVHIYWGHVPSILGWMSLQSDAKPTVTTSLGAYDLELALPIGFEVARRSGGVRTYAAPCVPEICAHEVPHAKIRLLHHGVSLKSFDDFRLGRTKRRPNHLVFAGRLIPEKGLPLLVDVMNRIHRTAPRAKLTILGDGPLRKTIERRVKQLGLENTVELWGHVSQTELIHELQQSSLFMLPSSLPSERLPNVIKEAAAAGCCCLTTATPGIETLIRDRESGRILSAEDADEWVTAITELLSNPELARKMAEVAKQNVHEYFDIEQTTSQQIAWWDRAVLAARHAQRAAL